MGKPILVVAPRRDDFDFWRRCNDRLAGDAQHIASLEAMKDAPEEEGSCLIVYFGKYEQIKGYIELMAIAFQRRYQAL